MNVTRNYEEGDQPGEPAVDHGGPLGLPVGQMTVDIESTEESDGDDSSTSKGKVFVCFGFFLVYCSF